ncbi:phage baseplate assembly protein V [Endozoicomonas gorgoniicola]|uniref:Phage baseplate assembly protein V n=1 Tax=Endozoicomonas gorgoniicola TaxID=1234144 RepID=A0ABT3MW98_9GAMM|nr:phage baseplate assembly protein V [Endozoicomonas gorgoniicola]MCW7553651.1 phage baseplate assembly protein V [Endozoicomonas gorgoniicola]
MNDPASLNQRIEKLLQFGTIAEIQFSPLRYRVMLSGSRTSYWLRHGFARMADSASWDPYRKGEQVLCAFPGGGRLGVVVCAVDSDQYRQRSTDPDVYRRDMPDGAVFEYNSQTHQLNIVLPAGATTALASNGSIDLTGDVNVTGNIQASGDITDSKSSMDALRGTYNQHANSNHSPPAPEMN